MIKRFFDKLFFVLQVGEESDATNIQCKCNHLTSFASDFLIAPNPIDMDKVIEGFKNIHNNVSVVVLLSLLFGIFALLVVRLRRLDKLDANKVITVIFRMILWKGLHFLKYSVHNSLLGLINFLDKRFA